MFPESSTPDDEHLAASFRDRRAVAGMFPPDRVDHRPPMRFRSLRPLIARLR